ncbi:MAG: tail fiber protein [Burkholderiaceae bacterium]|jgi:hypothetical protein|nr:tail fiber protein [Burkholderiaceae bacterium]
MWDIVVPVGAMMDWPVPTVPSSQWMERNGDILAISDFPELYAVLGTRYGGDGTDTFALPDDRANFIRGWDHGRGIDVGRVFGTEQGDAIRNIVGEFVASSNFGTLYSTYIVSGPFYAGGARSGHQSVSVASGGSLSVGFDSSLAVPTASENLVRNRAYLPIIRVLP